MRAPASTPRPARLQDSNQECGLQEALPSSLPNALVPETPRPLAGTGLSCRLQARCSDPPIPAQMGRLNGVCGKPTSSRAEQHRGSALGS